MASLGSGEPRGRGIGKENAIADGVVAEKFKELVRTEKEKKVPEMDDLEEEDLTKIAVAGKVLAPSKFHIQTINSARRPQWGNLRGLTFDAMCDNVFVAFLAKEQDLSRIWEGEGRHGWSETMMILRPECVLQKCVLGGSQYGYNAMICL
jgi:hypothetical protein